MFGFKNKIQMAQFRRAVSIENVLKAGIFDHQIESHGYNSTDNPPSKLDLLLFGASINYIFAGPIDGNNLNELKTMGKDREDIFSCAGKILYSDVDLERVVVRTLYDVASLGALVKQDTWVTGIMAQHPRIMEVLIPYKTKYPELFSDVTENVFKTLFERFVRVYSPSMQATTASLFS